MRAEGTFIAIEVDDAAAADTELARKLTEACPVDIFAQNDTGALELVQDNLDECVLCRLCLDAAAATGADAADAGAGAGAAGAAGADASAGGWDSNQAIRVIKLYDGSAVLA